LVILYNIFIFLYTLGIRIASLFNLKAKLWVKGRKDILKKIENGLATKKPGQKVAWFHCASLGEFEQGRPVIEAFRKMMPDHLIVLTFFSPSGYEIRKTYSGADHVFYLPADFPRTARKFIEILNPDCAFFIKYEYWYNYLSFLKKSHIPVYMVSAIFRDTQLFFKGYGFWFRKQLHNLTWFFVQDENSEKLLMGIGIHQVSVSGDTRFDRVGAISGQQKQIKGIREFCNGSKVILAGSTWPEDEKVLLPFIFENKEKYKFIIAPHEVHEARITSLMSQLGNDCMRFSKADEMPISDFHVLVIDSIGILSSLYRQAFVAYIGGGFGVGIHNILEPAAFGVPVIIGPTYQRFREARELILEGGAFCINNEFELTKVVQELTDFPDKHKRVSDICSEYVEVNKGATKHIIEHIYARTP
jgi:3-deoxy-D-manno-octulosonic-acid transferase